MARFDWSPRRARVDVAELPAVARTGVADPIIDVGDLSVLVRAWHGPDDAPPPAPTAVKSAQLTISRHDPDDFQDRQIYLFVNDEPWGKIRYGGSITREVPPGPHRVRAFNTLFSRTIAVDVGPGEHVRLRCGNGFPRAGWLLLMVLHVTYLLVRLEREPSA